MSILTWIEDKKRLKILAAPKHVDRSADSSKGLWTRCDKCGVILYIKHLKENQRVCFGCSYHLQMMSQERIENLLDKIPAPSSLRRKKSGTGVTTSLRPGGGRSSARETIVSTWRPLDETVSPCDPLNFHDQKDYTDRLRDAQERTGLQDAIQTGTGMIDGIPVALAVMDFSFMGGSMGSVVGEKLTRLVEYATQEGLTLLVVSASGGARMQEGVFSLMQMAKISSALQIYQRCANLLYISILSSPTTGGVTASFAMLGDIIFAEPKALIAFAGRRVIEQTLCEELPDDFQTSEYMLHHGLVDLIVPRRFLRQALSESIRLYQNAPFKKRGQIPFGVQNPITFLTEERVRRQWGRLAKGGTTSFVGQNQLCSANPDFFENQLCSANPDFFENQLCSANPDFRRKQLPLVPGTVLEDSSKRSFVLIESEDGALTGARTAMYREILTSFEIMLALFVSGNSKKQEQGEPIAPTKGRLAEHDLPKGGAGSTCKKMSGYAPKRLLVRGGVARNTKSRSFFARVGMTGSPKSVSHRVEGLSTTQHPQPFLEVLAKQGLAVRKPGFVRGGCCLQHQDKRFLMGFASQNVRTTLLTSRFFNSEYSISRDYTKNQPLYSLLKADSRTLQKTSFLSDHAYTLQSKANEVARNPSLYNGNTPISERIWRVAQADAVYNSNGNTRPSPGIKAERWRKPQKGSLLPALSKYRTAPLANQSRYKALFYNPSPCSLGTGRSKGKGLSNSRRKQSSLVRAFVPAKQNRLKGGSTAFSLKKNRGEGTQAEASIKNQPFSSSYNSNSSKARLALAKQDQPSSLLRQTPGTHAHAHAHAHALWARARARARAETQLQSKRKPMLSLASYPGRNNKRTLYKKVLICKKLTDLLKEIESGPRLFSTSVPGYTRLKQNFVREACFDFGLFSEIVPSQQKNDTTETYPTLVSQDQFQETRVYPERSQSNLLHSFRFFSEGAQTLKNVPGAGLASQDLKNAINRSAIGMTHTAYLSQRALSSPRFVGLQDQKEKVNNPAAHKSLQSRTHLYKREPLAASKPSLVNVNGSLLPVSSKGVQSEALEKASKDSSQLDLTSRENDIDFLNQAIELAATESIEWRAFYIHQQLSENTGFLEDFLQQDSHSRTKAGNVLFYKSICRSKKAIDG